MHKRHESERPAHIPVTYGIDYCTSSRGRPVRTRGVVFKPTSRYNNCDSHPPAVMPHDEVETVPGEPSGDKRLISSRMLGAGKRIMKCVWLRVQDLVSSRSEILVRDGKGARYRITMLPVSLKTPADEYSGAVKAIHEKDLADGWGRVSRPEALDRKYPNAPREWRWELVVTRKNRWRNPKSGEEGKSPLHVSIIQNAIADALKWAGLVKRAIYLSFRHSVVTQLLAVGYNIRTARELLGHKDMKTMVMYTHILNRGGKRVRSSMVELRGISGCAISKPYITSTHIPSQSQGTGITATCAESRTDS